MIRESKTQDLKAITEIYNDAILNTTAVYTYLETTVEERTQWMMKKQNEGWPLWVYEIEGNIAGFASYGTFRDWPAYQYTIEHSIYVSTQYRRKGVASKLLVRSTSFLSAWGTNLTKSFDGIITFLPDNPRKILVIT